MAVLGSRDGRCSLMFVDGGGASIRPIDDALVDGAVASPSRSELVALARLGDGFALVAPGGGVTRWSHFGAEPQRFRRSDAFPRNAHGFHIGVQQGGLSDDPNAALVLLHEPQRIDGATRFALLRFDEASASARWEWLLPNGEAPSLDKQDFPIPDYWRSSTGFEDVRPFLDHGAWIGGRLHFFVLGGLNANFTRWGMDYSVAALVEGGRAVTRWTAPESCWGSWSSSRRYLIVRPLRAKGPMKGASHVLDLQDDALHALEWPRGFSKERPLDHCDDIFWTTNDPSPKPRIGAFVLER